MEDGEGDNESDKEKEEEDGLESDYWGRKYESSVKYQWLPTYFYVDNAGNCTIRDYINNLVPKSNYTELYTSLEQLFGQALPQLESVYSYGRAMRKRLDDDVDYDIYLDEKYCSLKGQRLQVVTKIVDYELGPGESYEGVWHVEGMSHEEIVATAIYFLHRDDDVSGGNILFKRAFHKHEAEDIISSDLPQCRAEMQDKVFQDGLLPLGQVETLPNRLLVFPNSHVHKVRKIKNVSKEIDGEKQKRRIVVFFLINPEKRIISTREIEPQQEQAGGNMSHEEAFKHRLELMKERKFTKQDWNVREIELCEH